MKNGCLHGAFLSSIVASFFLYNNFLQAGTTSNQILQLHREIGSNLIEMRKNFPHLQPNVYTLLDQVGSLYRLSNKTLQKAKTVKKALSEEQKMRVGLQKENEKLALHISDIKQSAVQDNSRVAFYQKQCDDLSKERSDLIQRKTELEAKERDYGMRIKDLEKSLQKAPALQASNFTPASSTNSHH